MGKIKNYTVGIIKEGKRVRWPNKETMVSSLVIVLIITVFAALWLTFGNYVIARLLSALEEMFGSGAAQ